MILKRRGPSSMERRSKARRLFGQQRTVGEPPKYFALETDYLKCVEITNPLIFQRKSS